MNYKFKKINATTHICIWELTITNSDATSNYYYIHYDSIFDHYFLLFNKNQSTHIEFLVSNNICTIIENDKTCIKLILNLHILLESI
jgi:hypothetical protein